jgi:transcriptional regulator with XRE-family HTH domain
MRTMSLVKADQTPEAGQWIREQREARGLSVREFAAEMDVATQVIYEWQNGKSAVSEQRVEQLAEVLGVSIIEARRNLGYWVPEEVDGIPTWRLRTLTEDELFELLRDAPTDARDRALARYYVSKLG